MIYPDSFERKTGFDRVRRQVEVLCSTDSARALLSGEGFLRSRRDIERRLAFFDEMRDALMTGGGFPSGELTDTSGIPERLAVEGSVLDIHDMGVLHDALVCVEDFRCFFISNPRYRLLSALSARIAPFDGVISGIESVIDETGEVRDSASPELYSIRRSIQSQQGQASVRIQEILQRAIRDGIADQDAAVSVRDGRPVIPVQAVSKRRVPGFVHDQSSTGRTYFIEPVEVVEINNALRELQMAEKQEIQRIISDLTERMRPQAEDMVLAGAYLARMDMLRAKALWAVENSAVRPIVSDDGRFVLRQAFHPLLRQTLTREGRETVPLDLTLDSDNRILVISGPNAGGKSVCLKTVGLIQYMFQCGFPVCALPNSELPVFGSVFIDIGDEQSMDNDLSTYSSHLRNMRCMLTSASNDSLILIDEFGSGTEPTIGGAIAEAMLERFLEIGVYGIVNTHYSNLKYFAGSHDGVSNGAMMFDVQNIQPLFRLEQGMPGSSFAVEIARKSGIPESIIRSASDKVGTDYMSVERQLREIARDRRYWEQKRDRIRIADRKVEELETSYSEQLSSLRAERARIITQAKEEAGRILAQANRQVENTIRQIKEAEAEKTATRMARSQMDTLRKEMEVTEEDTTLRDERIEREMRALERRRQKREERRRQRGEAPAVAPPAEPEPEKEISVGSKVRLIGQETAGEVTAVKGDRITVTFGQMQTVVGRDRLEQVSNSVYRRQNRTERPRTVIGFDISERKLNFRDSIDIRGLRVDEAMERLTAFIDDAIMVGIGSVSVLHGKGTGALREEVRRYLSTVGPVESFGDDHADRGGAGITVVRFMAQ